MQGVYGGTRQRLLESVFPAYCAPRSLFKEEVMEFLQISFIGYAAVLLIGLALMFLVECKKKRRK